MEKNIINCLNSIKKRLSKISLWVNDKNDANGFIVNSNIGELKIFVEILEKSILLLIKKRKDLAFEKIQVEKIKLIKKGDN